MIVTIPPSASVLSGTSTICAGSSTNLSIAITGGVSPYTVVYSDGTTNITEASYTTGSAIAVSPITSTTYNLVSITDANGCVGTGLIGTSSVTVNPLPTITVTPINSSTCGGSDGQLAFTFTNVPDGTYTINYKDVSNVAQTLSGVTVNSNKALVTNLSASIFTDFQIISNGCTSALGVSQVLADPVLCASSFLVDNTGGNSNGSNMFMGDDPCSCNGNQVLNADGTVATPGTFSEVVTITGPANLFVRVKTITDAALNPFTLSDNRLTETPPGSGTYEITFNHTDRLGYSITEFEYASTAAEVAAGTYTLVTSGAPDFDPVTISNVCAYPRVICSPLASSLMTTDAPINLSVTELSKDVSFIGVTQFTINNSTVVTAFDPASTSVVVGNNIVVGIYDIEEGTGMGGTIATPAIPINVSGPGVCPISLPAKSIQVIAPPVAANTIPTMSQWGLIIFGLLILNMGIVLLYRRENLEDLFKRV